jgi:hypothetical protein
MLEKGLIGQDEHTELRKEVPDVRIKIDGTPVSCPSPCSE